MILFWENVIKKLQREEMTQAELCRLTNIAKGTFQNWLKFNRYPPADRAVKISQILNVTVEELTLGQIPLDTHITTRLSRDESFRGVVATLSILEHEDYTKIRGMIELYAREKRGKEKTEKEKRVAAQKRIDMKKTIESIRKKNGDEYNS